PTTNQATIDAAQALVNKVTDPTTKAALQADVDKAQNLLDAKNAATAAEKAKQDAAKKAVDELFNNNTPSSNAIKPTTDQAAVDAAQALVNKVTDPTTKAALQADVDKAKSLLANNANNTIDSIDTYVSGTSYLTGKASAGVTRVGLYVNGVLVKTAAASNGSYQIYAGATPEMKIDGQIFEVAALTAAGVPGHKLSSMVSAKTLKTLPKLAAPVVDTFYVGDSNVTGTLPTGAVKVGLYVDGSLVRYGAITGNTFKIYAYDVAKLRSAGQEFKVVVVDATGQESDYTTSKVEVNNAKVTPDVNASTSNYLKGDITGNVKRIGLYIDGSLVRYGTISGQTYSIYVYDVAALKQSGTEYELRALDDNGRVLYSTKAKTK
ncbi:toxin Cry1Ac domain D-VI-related protein, partial [Listeria grandensis]|uniref:toxin Cry1Ac domain D-VI-related protein n=1 Tax=Listeria grandensis TaxID=1494963 RepID=UPI00164ED5A0